MTDGGLVVTDRVTKASLCAIAAGVWMNVATQWLQPASVHTERGQAIGEAALMSHRADVRDLGAINNGSYRNS